MHPQPTPKHPFYPYLLRYPEHYSIFPGTKPTFAHADFISLYPKGFPPCPLSLIRKPLVTAPHPARLNLINTNPDYTPEQVIRLTLCTDFPLFERRCELSPTLLCSHPGECKQAEFSLIGYCKLDSQVDAHYIPLPEPPEPKYSHCCLGCDLPYKECEEGCDTFVETLVGYWVHVWDLNKRNFTTRYVQKKEYNPQVHGYFSARKYKQERAYAKQKHRKWQREQHEKRENKRTRTETEDEIDLTGSP